VAEILRFDTNVPVEVALRFSDGKHVEGRYGDQVMYSLEGDQIIYVPPVVEQRIQDLQIGKGELFEICKPRTGCRWSYQKGTPKSVP
jgi:hypothetical protein